ncbi:MAG: FkbM family methyltransferase [bacterium]
MPVKEINFLDYKIKVNLRDEADVSVASEIFNWREYRSAEEVIKNTTNPILDIGAHAGFFSIYARLLNDSVTIYAVEPHPENIKALGENLKANHIDGVKILALAIADKTGEGKLAVSEDSHNHKLSTDEKISDLSIKTSTLLDLLEKYKIDAVGLLKMDIEGAEYAVLTALKPGDWLKIDHLVLEYHDDTINHHRQLEKLIRENGFSVQIFPSMFDKSMGFIMARNKRK